MRANIYRPPARINLNPQGQGHVKLGLALQRLGDDWQQVHGHPLPLAETFVDPARFAGTRYRAAGWQELGMTRGFAEKPTRYRHHGQPKIVFVKPLRP
ncbi:MAG: DUF4338 domain-containing protein [Magnetococcales bacterium]|nr:DUF4338 domain-containing protein [Magnetococcales bacterium]